MARSAEAAGAPALSVVIATGRPWPEMRRVLDSVAGQASALGAEIVVVDGDGAGLPEDHGYEGVRWLRLPGRDVARLRAVGLAEARGEIVAMTEDHCEVAPDWCESVLRAHREYPEAAMIGGVVTNGADRDPWDWANFLVSNGPFLPPIPTGERPDIAGQANLSYKRWALPASVPADGMEEAAYKRELRAGGHTLVNDDRLVVAHVQDLGAWGGCMIHFHDGRSTAALAGSRAGRARRVYLTLRALLLPLRVARDSTRIVARTVVRKPGYRALALRLWPLVAVVLCFHAGGEFAGYALGPGDSRRMLR
jgi:hypothetical protein